LRAHATQVRVADGAWALSHGRGVRLDGVEHFRLVTGVAAPGPDGLEHDLFAGLGGGS
jgi:N-acetyl-1-D-myo-inositol-2-amino-2-deoxy-alpha-D-glucopyranoside deacetylase